MIYPGRIIKYYPDTQTADINVSAERVFSNMDGLKQTKPRAELKSVPVHTSSGGGWSITFNILPGDTCLIVLSAVGYDHWLFNNLDAGGLVAGQPAPQLSRKFSEDDGFAIVGLNTIPQAIADYSTDGSQWRNSNAAQNIHLKDNGAIEVNSAVRVDITAPDILLDGNVTITGSLVTHSTIQATGEITGSGTDLSTHTHTGDSGGTTSPPL